MEHGESAPTTRQLSDVRFDQRGGSSRHRPTGVAMNSTGRYRGGRRRSPPSANHPSWRPRSPDVTRALTVPERHIRTSSPVSFLILFGKWTSEDEDGTRGVLDAVLADRTQQHSGECAPAPAAYDKQVC